MEKFQQHLRKRIEAKIDKPFARFPLINGKHELAHEALNHTREALGLRADIEVRPVGRKGQTLVWPRIRLTLREPFLEFWGAFIMVLLGNSVSAQTYLSNHEYGTWLNVCLGWSCAYMFGIYIAGDSGAYLNPAVTLTNCLFRGLPSRRFPTYAMAQFLGSFCAHGVTYANYMYAFDAYAGPGVRTIPPDSKTTARIFCTFPAGDWLPIASRVFSEFLANFVNLFCIFAMRDENGADLKGGGWFVLALFWLNFGLMSSLGWETGSPINPARDVTGRIWLSILGYKNAWSAFDNYSWIPIIVPFCATISGAIVYDVFIYTGDSPINKPGMGIPGLVRWIMRRPDPPPTKDEEQAHSGQHTPHISGDTQYSEGGAESKRSSADIEEVHDKNTPWDQPKNKSENTRTQSQTAEVAQDEHRGAGAGEDMRGIESHGMEAQQQKTTLHDPRHSEQSHGMGDPQRIPSHDSSRRKSSSREAKSRKLQQKTNKNVEYDGAGGGDDGQE